VRLKLLLQLLKTTQLALLQCTGFRRHAEKAESSKDLLVLRCFRWCLSSTWSLAYKVLAPLPSACGVLAENLPARLSKCHLCTLPVWDQEVELIQLVVEILLIIAVIVCNTMRDLQALQLFS